jgi:hypothetical protein
MWNVIPFTSGGVDFDAIEPIRQRSERDREKRIDQRMRALAYAFPASVALLAMHKPEMGEMVRRSDTGRPELSRLCAH